MLGSVRPYRRQVCAVSSRVFIISFLQQIVISTGKSDWDREITDTKGSLAHYLSQVETKVTPSPPVDSRLKRVPGVFNSSDSTKTSILNGSHHTLCEDPLQQTVLIFPDYKLVTEVSCTAQGARDFWDYCIDPHSPGAGSGGLLEKSPMNSWVIPYSCVILLCKSSFHWSISLVQLTSYPQALTKREIIDAR